jgi:uncharacterized protein YPO0396
MKKLTAVRLVNWYHILDETLPIEGSALFMGDNGSGKSTILDAVQFALVADLTQVKFNQAANENAARSLQGYTRWMTNSSGGKETYQYNRGDCTSYVLLEFTESLPEGEHRFVIGAVIDSFKDGRDPRRLHFAANHAVISDIPVYRENSRVPLVTSEFRKLMTPRKGFFGSTEPGPFRDDLLTRLGKLSPDFTKVLVKAQAFKPLGQVQQFVMDFLLDDRPLDTQSLQTNLSNYKGLELKAREAEKRVAHLERIAQKGSELQRLTDEIRTFRYLELRALAGVEEHNVARLSQERESAESEKKRGEEEIQRLEASLAQCELEIGSLYRSLSQDSVYQERERTRLDLVRAEDEREKIARELAASQDASLRLDRLKSEILQLKLALSDGPYRELSFQTRIQKERHQTEMARIKEQGESLQNRLKDLERGVRNYPSEVRALKSLIEDQLGCEAPLLCELLEVDDEKWQPAVEGYLNTRRFDIVLDPKYFQKALSLYEKMKRQLQIHGVGLVDSEKVMKTHRAASEGTLGELVSSANPWAKAYADFILGDLVRCETEKELRKHSRAITPTCMVYQNYAARQTPFHIFDTWFIGKRGHASQLENTKKEIEEAHSHFVAQAALLNSWLKASNLCETGEKLEAEASNLGSLQIRSESAILEVDRLNAHLTTIQTDHLEVLERRLESLRLEKNKMASDRDAALKITARAEQSISDLIVRIQESERLRDLHFSQIAQEFSPEAGGALHEERYSAELVKGRTPAKIHEVFSNQRKNRETQKSNILDDLTLLRSEYNNTFAFAALAQGEVITPYLDELKSWKESFLPEYHQKILAAKDSALQQLMEDIVHKLRENLDQIPSQFEQINRALRGFHFGYDQYQFIYRVKREYQAFERLIREAAEYERQPLFQTSWKERFRDGGALEALFESLVSGSSSQVQDELKQYSDYREYYEYDLKILHADGTDSLYSQVNRWKSGGETQAPYYIAVLASLYRLYRLRPEQGGKQQRGTIGLVILDEAFNKMDEDRLQATLKFTRTLGLQLLMATPKERAEFIIPHVESCWIVGKDPTSGFAYLQDFHQDPMLEIRSSVGIDHGAELPLQ